MSEIEIGSVWTHKEDDNFCIKIIAEVYNGHCDVEYPNGKKGSISPSVIKSVYKLTPTIDHDINGKPVVSDGGVDTNPKKQFGDKSLPLNIWPALASAYGALGLYNGKLKYGQSNFNATPVEASIYIAGAMRHLAAWSEGEEFDPADGVPNLGGVLANIAILLEARAAGTLIDDRKLGSGYLKERDNLKEIVASLQVLHKDKQPVHYTLKDVK